MLLCGIIFLILLGFVFKFLSLIYTNSQDTFSGTHNRIDALAWGVLLNIIILNKGEVLRKKKILKIFFFLLGLIILILTLFIKENFGSFLFIKIYFHTLLPISFFFMLLGVYYYNFSKLKILRFIAYYSYNWYLWHWTYLTFPKFQLSYAAKLISFC